MPEHPQEWWEAMAMKVHQDNLITIYQGGAQKMVELTPESVQCVVTSPPYWGLRKYAGEQELVWDNNHLVQPVNCGHEWGDAKTIAFTPQKDNSGGLVNNRLDSRGEQAFTQGTSSTASQGQFCQKCGAWRGAYGLEPTIEMYAEHTLVFLREIRRVLRKDGTLFLNLRDSYASTPGLSKVGSTLVGSTVSQDASKGVSHRQFNGLKPKDLCLIPFRVALAAQADGWWVRSVIIWAKNNPMPESVRDRPTESHEYILMLTKSAKYYWDQEAVREKANTPLDCKSSQTFGAKGGKVEQIYGAKHLVSGKQWVNNGGRNIRSVWPFPSQPYPEAHFATFPEELPKRCILAATPEKGSCARCGKPWVRVVDTKLIPQAPRSEVRKENWHSWEVMGTNVTQTLGWKAQCDCGVGTVPALVLDPFCGSGTTLWVAKKLGRRAVGYDISAEYCQLALERNRQMSLIPPGG